MKRKVKISQCMIVKNEEKNIRRALTWAKDIVFEQIVVDTGSIDRTVEIAEEMGAKVYHFQWIDDFAAAKNYAIEQASGEWIVFLDADEYMNKEDTRKLVRLLERIPVPKKGEKLPLFIRCALVQLDDNGKPFSVDPQDRIFRNRKDLRYQGRIHEQIQMPPGGRFTFIQAENLSIFHTGYGNNVYAETGKLQRNIEMLERELEQDPDNYMAWSYLGDAQKASGDLEGAKISYRKALEGKNSGNLAKQRYYDARSGLMQILTGTKRKAESEEEVLRWVKDYGYPDTGNPDPWFYLGVWNYNRGRMGEARWNFLNCLEKLETYRSYERVTAEGYLCQIYAWLAQACLQLKRPQEVVRYCVLSLRMERYQDQVLTAVLQLLKQEPGEADQAAGTWKFLQGLYDFQNLKDLLFLLKCAKLAGFHALEARVIQALPEDLRGEFEKGLPSGVSGDESCGIGGKKD